MSGTKSTDVFLERKAQLLLQVRQQQQTASKSIEKLVTKLNDLCLKIDKISIADNNITKKFKDHQNALQQELINLNQRQDQLKKIQPPITPKNLNIDTFEINLKNILKIEEENSHTSQLIDKFNCDIINLSIADKDIVNIEHKIQKFKDELQMYDYLLKKWLPNDYNNLIIQYNKINAKLKKNNEDLKNGKDSSIVKMQYKIIDNEIEQLFNKINHLLQTANEREKMHQQRLYILTGLREVCASLGFEEVTEPQYIENGDYNSEVVQTFDTIDQGMVTFRIYLDNSIESDSGINIKNCQEEFDHLSDLLMEEYGVKTDFRPISQQHSPTKITFSTKPIPKEKSNKRTIGNRE